MINCRNQQTENWMDVSLEHVGGNTLVLQCKAILRLRGHLATIQRKQKTTSKLKSDNPLNKQINK